MVRILQIISSLRKNGTETFVMNVFRKLNHDEISFDFLVFEDSKSGFYNEIISSGSKVYFLPPRKEGLRRYHKKLNEFFKKKSYEYHGVHMHCTSLTTIAPLFYAKKYGIPLRITHMHGSNCKGIHNRIFHSFNKYRIGNVSNYLFACSTKAARWGFDKNSTPLIVPNGINLDAYKFNIEKRKEYRAKFKIKEDEILAIHVGMLHPVKNHKFLIDIINEVKKQRVKIKLLCVGEGELKESLLNYVRNQNLSEQIYFLGHRDDVPGLLSASDIFLFPSLHEGFGLAVLEAQVNGLPVFASSSLPTDVVLSNSIDLLQLNEGPQKWAKKILELDRKQITRGFPDEINRYSIDNTISELSRIYLKEKL